MAKFKCIHTGTVVEFFTEYDDESMRKHPEYEEVLETPKQNKQKQPEVKKED